MGTVPTLHTWVNNEQPNFRDMNAYLEDPLNFLMNPPMVRLRKLNALNIATATPTDLPWDYVEVETVPFWDSSQPTRITPSVPGWYVGTFGFSFAANSTGIRTGTIVKNNSGTDRVLSVNHDAYTSGTAQFVSRGNSFMESFNGTTDYIVLNVQQNSGGNLAVLVDVIEKQPDLVLRWFAAL